MSKEAFTLEVLEALMSYRYSKRHKLYKAIKVFDVAFKDEEKQNFLKKGLEKDEDAYKIAVVHNNEQVYSVLFEECDNEEVISYSEHMDDVAYIVAYLFNKLPFIEYVDVDKELFDEKDFLEYEEYSEEKEKYILEDFHYYYEKASRDIEYSREIYQDIKSQISELDEEWQYFDLNIEYKDEMHHIKVPKLAFIYNSLDVRYASDNLRDFNIPDWNPISSSGVKTNMDNPYHTDYWVGMGFTINSAYYRDEFEADECLYSLIANELNELKYEIQEKYWNYRSFSVGSAVKSQGKVMHYDKFKDDFSKIKSGSIIILPHLGMEFEEAIHYAIKDGKGGVIAEEGGRTSHIAIMGRKIEFPIFVENNALEKYRWVQRVKLDGVNKTIDIR